ncbi:hypothetical protein KX816_07490 [Sphingosinicellaceae bacterium]|nr:hypothetical protein KX816_07490 [Sphingosinicellaceae bacterium]
MNCPLNLRRFIVNGVLAVALLGLGTAASARRVNIDSSATPFTPCTIGTACASTPVSFSVNFGFGAFDGLYIYDNGLVSIGAPIAAGADFGSLALIGGNVFTAGYSSAMTLSNFRLQDPANAVFDFPGSPVIRVLYDATFDDVTAEPMEFSIFDNGGGDFVLQFNHGDPFDETLTPDIASDAYLGYSFGGSGSQIDGATLHSEVQGAATEFRFSFPAGGGSPTPEPAAWLMLTVGFLAAGSAVRGRRSLALGAVAA